MLVTFVQSLKALSKMILTPSGIITSPVAVCAVTNILFTITSGFLFC